MKLTQSQPLLLHPRNALWPWLSTMTRDFNCLWLMDSDIKLLKISCYTCYTRYWREKAQSTSYWSHLPNRSWSFVLKQESKLKTVSSFPFQSGLMGTHSVVNVEPWSKQKLTHSLAENEAMAGINSCQ